VTAAGVVYVVGLVLALWRTDAPWLTRIGLAILWPFGPMAFLVTVSVLLAASFIAFPTIGAVVFGGALLTWWMLS
jgi:hypothetical protein